MVVGRRRDGRREFDEDVRGLVEFCLKPGVSIARAAMDHDVNSNQLRRWISRHQQHVLQTPTRPDPLVIDGVSINIPGSARRFLEMPKRRLVTAPGVFARRGFDVAIDGRHGSWVKSGDLYRRR
ncbi:MAG: transposase [Burkholderiales bacterium]|nr:transposase [Burkholderiales bacterium]